MAPANRIALVGLMLLLSVPARAEFDPSAYQAITQSHLVANAEASLGRKFRITDSFQYCGSDFCVQVLRTKINTREYYCFAMGSVCMIRFYLKKDHPDAAVLLKFKKGDTVTVYGTFDRIGNNFNYLVADRVALEKGP